MRSSFRFGFQEMKEEMEMRVEDDATMCYIKLGRKKLKNFICFFAASFYCSVAIASQVYCGTFFS
jgi:hypothetical protein